MKNIPLIVVTALFLILGTWLTISFMKEINRLKGNESILLSDNGKLKTEVGSLNLSTKELKLKVGSDSALKKILKDSLGLKEKQVKSLTKALSNIHVETGDIPILPGMIIIHDTSYLLPTFTWKDNWTYISGYIYQKDSINYANIIFDSKDTLFAVTYWKWKIKWLPWVSGKKWETTVKGVNPHTNYFINYNIQKQ